MQKKKDNDSSAGKGNGIGGDAPATSDSSNGTTPEERVNAERNRDDDGSPSQLSTSNKGKDPIGNGGSRTEGKGTRPSSSQLRSTSSPAEAKGSPQLFHHGREPTTTNPGEVSPNEVGRGLEPEGTSPGGNWDGGFSINSDAGGKPSQLRAMGKKKNVPDTGGRDQGVDAKLRATSPAKKNTGDDLYTDKKQRVAFKSPDDEEMVCIAFSNCPFLSFIFRISQGILSYYLYLVPCRDLRR